MATIQEAEQSVNQARQRLDEQRKRAELRQAQLRGQKASLPEIKSQQALRQKYKGLAGRIKRKEIQYVSSNLTEQAKEVQKYQGELAQYEETQLKPVENQIVKAKEQQRSYQRIRKLILDERWQVLGWYKYKGTPYERDLIRDYFAMRKLKPAKEVNTVSYSGLGEETIGYAKIGDPDSIMQTDVKTYVKTAQQYPELSFRETMGRITKPQAQISTAFIPLGELETERQGLNKYGQYGTRTDIGTPEWNKQQEELRKSNLRADALASIPAQYLGTVFEKPISSDLAEKGAEGNFIQRAGTFLDPRYQYEIAKEHEQYKRDLGALEGWNKRIEKAEKDLEAGRITTDRYNAVVTAYQNSPVIQRLQKPSSNAWEGIAESDLSSGQKFGLGAGIRVSQTIPYFTPAGRAILGTEMAREGSQYYNLATTKQEKTLSGIQTGLGVGLALSGFGRLGGGIKYTGTTNQLNWLRGAGYSSGVVLGGTLGVVDYYSTKAKYGDNSLALGAGIGTGGTIITGTLWKPITQKVKEGYNKLGEFEGIKNKRASRQAMSSQESEYIYDYKTGKYIKKAEVMSRTQATGEFSRASTERQVNIIKEAFKNRAYLDSASARADLNRATVFMRESGLSNNQIKKVLQGAFPDLFKVTSPVVQSQGGVLSPASSNVLKVNAPVMVGGTGSASTFTASGNYEQALWTTGATQFGQRQDARLKDLSLLDVKPLTKTETKQDSLLDSKTETKQDLALFSGLKSQSTLDTKQLSLLENETKQESKQDLQTGQISLLKSKQELRQPSLLDTRPRPRRQDNRPKDPKPKKPIKPVFDNLLMSWVRKKAKDPEEKIEVFGKRFGKDVSLGMFRSKKGAEKKLKSFLGGTLGASGFLSKEGKKIESDLFKSPRYRKSKVDPFRVVEKREFRLSAPSEKSEIQYFKKKSKKKSKKAGWL